MSLTANGPAGQVNNSSNSTGEKGSGSSGVAILEAEIQGLLESLLELGVCTTEVHPSAVEASPNGNGGGINGNGNSGSISSMNGNDNHDALTPDGTPGMVNNARRPYTGYKHSGGLVGQKVQEAIQSMQIVFNAHNIYPDTRDLHVPHEVIDYVDQGRNPEIYTRELLDRVSGENMYTNGILDAVASYQALLASEMKLAFPNLKDAIDELEIASTPTATNGT